MPFHVRLQRQVLFTEETYNLSEPELRRRFVEPWLAGKPIIVKGRTWVPERSRIAILEGPDLTSTQRSWVQGWTKAIELSENVTDRFLHPPPIPAEPEHGESRPERAPGENTELTEASESSAKPASKAWYQTMFDVSTARGAFTTALVAGLAVVIVAPLVTSLPSLPYKGARSLYFAFAISAGEAFDLENDVRHRPSWQGTPTLYGKSFSYAVDSDVGNSDGGNPAQTSGIAVVHHSISELAEKAVEFDGVPTEFVGRVRSEMTVSSSDQTPLATEYVLTGRNLGAVAFVGLSSVNSAITLSAGETVVVRGVVVASGVAREVSGSTHDAVYVMALSSQPIGATGTTEEDGSLQTLAKEARESG
jgi:hypothetical protein